MSPSTPTLFDPDPQPPADTAPNSAARLILDAATERGIEPGTPFDLDPPTSPFMPEVMFVPEPDGSERIVDTATDDELDAAAADLEQTPTGRRTRCPFGCGGMVAVPDYLRRVDLAYVLAVHETSCPARPAPRTRKGSSE